MQRRNLQWQRQPTLVLVWRVQPQMQGLSWQVSRPQRKRLQWSKLGTSLFVPYRTWRQKSTMENWRVRNHFQLVWLKIGHIWGVWSGRNECWMLPKTWWPQSTMVNSIKIFYDPKSWNKPDAHCCWWWWTQVKLHIILIQPKLWNHRFIFRQQFPFQLKSSFLVLDLLICLEIELLTHYLSPKICKKYISKSTSFYFWSHGELPCRVQPACTGTTSNDNQLWYWSNGNNLKCKAYPDKILDLNVQDHNDRNWGQVSLYHTEHGGENQQWTIDGCEIKSNWCNLRLDIFEGCVEAGTNVGCYQKNDAPNQQWRVVNWSIFR